MAIDRDLMERQLKGFKDGVEKILGRTLTSRQLEKFKCGVMEPIARQFEGRVAPKPEKRTVTLRFNPHQKTLRRIKAS